jgi:hypothetical protein
MTAPDRIPLRDRLKEAPQMRGFPFHRPGRGSTAAYPRRAIRMPAFQPGARPPSGGWIASGLRPGGAPRAPSGKGRSPSGVSAELPPPRTRGRSAGRNSHRLQGGSQNRSTAAARSGPLVIGGIQSRRCGSRVSTTPTAVRTEMVMSATGPHRVVPARSNRDDDRQNEGAQAKPVDDAVQAEPVPHT